MNSPLSTTVAADEFDDEEKKMEKFYELIRIFKEAREDHQRTILRLRLHNHNQRRNHTDNSNFTTNNKINNSDYNQQKIKDNEIQGNAIWMPSFKWEDFRGINHNQEEDNQNRDRNQVVLSDKSGINLLHDSSNCVDYIMDNENNNSSFKKIDKNDNSFKKRKISDVDDDDEDDDEITTVDHFKNQRPQPFDTGLDLNLAL